MLQMDVYRQSFASIGSCTAQKRISFAPSLFAKSEMAEQPCHETPSQQPQIIPRAGILQPNEALPATQKPSGDSKGLQNQGDQGMSDARGFSTPMAPSRRSTGFNSSANRKRPADTDLEPRLHPSLRLGCCLA